LTLVLLLDLYKTLIKTHKKDDTISRLKFKQKVYKFIGLLTTNLLSSPL